MSDITTSLKRVPRWVWLTTAGLTIGAFGVRMYRNRATAANPDGTASTQADPTVMGNDYYGTAGVSSSPAGVIVPPVIISGSNQDPTAASGGGSGLADTLNAIGGVVGALQPAPQQPIDWPATISAIAGAGSPPQPVQQNPPYQAPDPPPAPAPAPTPAPAPAPAAAAKCPSGFPMGSPGSCFKVEYDNRTRDNGKKGAARAVWCNRVTIHRYQDGRPPVVVNEDKVKNGPC